MDGAVNEHHSGRAFREARTVRGLRQEDVAARTGLSHRTIVRLEARQDWSAVSVGTISRLAGALELSYAALSETLRVAA